MRSHRLNVAMMLLGCLLAGELAWLSWMRANAPARLASDPPAEVVVTRPSGSPAPIAEAEPEPGAASRNSDWPDERPPERVAIPQLPREPQCTIEVLGPDSRPRSYSQIVAMRGGDFAWRTCTNQSGLQQVPPSPAPLDLFVDAGTTIHREPGVVVEDGGRIRIVIPETLAISGWVTFDDRLGSLPENFWIEVIRESPWPAELPALVRHSLDQGWPVHVPVERDGSFRIAGFDADFVGRLAIRPLERVALVDPARPDQALLSIPISGGARGVTLHVRRFPILSGSIPKDPTMGFGQRRVRVTVVATMPDSTTVSRWNGCDLGSRFEIPLDFQTPVALKLIVESLEGDMENVVEVEGPYTADVDVGTLDVPPSKPRSPRAEDVPTGWWPSGGVSMDDLDSGEPSRGKVVDEAGSPIAFALVRVNSAYFQTTDESGAFEYKSGLPPRINLEITAHAHVPLVMHDLDVAMLDGRDFVMKSGRSVRLTVVDQRGEPFVRPHHLGHCDHGWEASVTVWGRSETFYPDDGLGAGEVRWGGHPASPAGPGIYDFRGLPDGPIVFHVEGVEGPVYTLEHDSRAGPAKLVVPTHGSLRLNLEQRPDTWRIRVAVTPTSPGGTKLAFGDRSDLTYRGTFLLPALLPGEYSVSVEKPADPGARAWRPFGSEARVTVRAAETTTVVVGR